MSEILYEIKVSGQDDLDMLNKNIIKETKLVNAKLLLENG